MVLTPFDTMLDLIPVHGIYSRGVNCKIFYSTSNKLVKKDFFIKIFKKTCILLRSEIFRDSYRALL